MLNQLCGNLVHTHIVYSIDGLAQDCSNCNANTMELLQYCAKPSIWWAACYTRGYSQTTSSFSNQHLASLYCTKTTASRDETHFSFGIWCALCKRFDGNLIFEGIPFLLYDKQSGSQQRRLYGRKMPLSIATFSGKESSETLYKDLKYDGKTLIFLPYNTVGFSQ